VIGTPVEDAHIRLECWKLGVQMAGNEKHNAENVAILSTAAYNFVAGGEKSSSSDSRDKSKKTPNR
jgi:hypothetical protein